MSKIDSKPIPRWSIRAVKRDPVLEQVLNHISKLTAREIERKSGVCASTILAWRSGKTRRPQSLTIEYALRAAGFRRVIVPDDRKR